MRKSLTSSLALVAGAFAVTAVLAGSGAAASNVTPPRYLEPPTVQTVRVGQTLIASPGKWNGSSPMSFYYQWMYGTPAASTPIHGATGPTYTLRPGDAGKQIWVQVKAVNSAGHFWANSIPTEVVAGPNSIDGITLLDGRTSIPVSQVDLSNRLVVATIQFNPLSMKANGSATLQVTVADRYHRPVRGAKVEVTAVPFGSIDAVSPALTDTTGVAKITLHGRPKVLDHVPGNQIALYIQATKPGGNTLTGVTGTRLVGLKITH